MFKGENTVGENDVNQRVSLNTIATLQYHSHKRRRQANDGDRPDGTLRDTPEGTLCDRHQRR